MLGKHKREDALVWDKDAVPKPMPWLVDGFILQGGITALLGPEKVGKSRLIGWWLAHMLAHPQGGLVMKDEQDAPWCGHNGFRKVLYLNAEEQATDVMARVNEYARADGLEPSDDWPIMCLPAAAMQLHRQRDRDEFEKEFLATNEFDFVIIDPMRRVHAGNENDNSSMAPLHNDMRRWSQERNQTWLIVHHSGHFKDTDDMGRIATWCRGATDLPAILDGALMMRTVVAEKGMSVRALKRGGRFAPEPDISLLDYGDPAGFKVRP